MMYRGQTASASSSASASVVGIEAPEDLRFWAEKLQVHENVLREAVGTVGDREDNIRQYLAHLERVRRAEAP
jgi:hypothetical protein